MIAAASSEAASLTPWVGVTYRALFELVAELLCSSVPRLPGNTQRSCSTPPHRTRAIESVEDMNLRLPGPQMFCGVWVF